MTTNWWQVNINLLDVATCKETATELVSHRAFESGAKSIWEDNNRLVIGFDSKKSADEFGSAYSVQPIFIEYEFKQPDLGGVSFELPNGTDLEIKLDTSRSFGHGKHPTTSLAMTAIAKQPQHGKMLDVGAGTGILSILAAKLDWDATAVDNNPDALSSTIENCELNDVELQQTAQTIEEIKGQFDLVVANLVVSAHQQISEQIMAAVKPAGTLVLTGFHTNQLKPITTIYQQFQYLEESTLDGWACLECKQT